VPAEYNQAGVYCGLTDNISHHARVCAGFFSFRLLSKHRACPVCACIMAYGRMDDSPTEYKPRSEQTAICSAILCEVVTVVSGCTVFDYAFHNVYCAALFRCGCTFPWAGGASGCNIHNVHGPRCPWCNVLNSNLFLLAPLITDHFTVLLMCCAYYVARYRSLSFEKRLAIAAATFLGWGFIMGALFYLLTDYPCFLWINNDGKGCALKSNRPSFD